MLNGNRLSVPCNICGSNETRLVYQKWTFNIVQCVACGLVYVNPRAFRVEEDDYFEGPYLSTIEKDGHLDEGIATLYGQIIHNLNQRAELGKLLDVGCAMGHFLEFARKYGWDVEGVECSPYAAKYATERFGFQVHPVCALKDAHLQPDCYNSCVLVEVIEHLPDPREAMTEVWRLLQPGGLVYLTTPNFSSYLSLLVREHWYAIIPAGHLYYFDSSSLGKLLSSVGFTDVETVTLDGDFAKDFQLAKNSGLLTLTPEEVATIGELPPTGRGDCLAMCARKPWLSAEQESAARERIARRTFSSRYDGCLVRRPGETANDMKVYYVEQGQKRWVTTADWIIAKGMKWPDAVQFISAEELDGLVPGPALP